MQTTPTVKLANVDTNEESSVIVRIFGDSVFFLNAAGETLMNVEVYSGDGTMDGGDENEEMIRVFVSKAMLFNSEDFDEYQIPTKRGAA
jgi:hypothetical protein